MQIWKIKNRDKVVALYRKGIARLDKWSRTKIYKGSSALLNAICNSDFIIGFGCEANSTTNLQTASAHQGIL